MRNVDEFIVQDIRQQKSPDVSDAARYEDNVKSIRESDDTQREHHMRDIGSWHIHKVRVVSYKHYECLCC